MHISLGSYRLRRAVAARRSLLGAGILLLAAQAIPVRAQSVIQGTVTGVEDGAAITGALVTVVQLKKSALTDSTGVYSIDGVSPGRFDVSVHALGHVEVVHRVDVSDQAVHTVDFQLRIRPVHLSPLTARARREQRGGTVERSLWDREVSVGLMGVSGEELRAVPVLAEADVVRALQAVPGVLPLNPLSARLHVQGGAPDQNMFLWEGARVFAPYHMFGIFGAFNVDAVGRTEFHRGHIPARFGGILTSVIDLAARAPTVDTLSGNVGLGLLGLRGTAHGQSRNGKRQWLISGRRTHADLVSEHLLDNDFPYGFFDLMGRFSTQVGPQDVVSASGFASSDRFRMFLDGGQATMSSGWRNVATSASWARERPASSTRVNLWGSGYHGSLIVGEVSSSPETRNRLYAGGLDVEHVQQGRSYGYRVGASLDFGTVSLDGADTGGYVTGEESGSSEQASVFGEFERWVGPLRVRPGLRVSHELEAARTFLEPRVSARLHFTDDAAVTVALERTHQFLSTLQDDRYVVPGAPFWVMHRPDQPASRSDRLSVGADIWHERRWSVEVGGYLRRFQNVVRWRPTGRRDIGSIEFDDGRAAGASLMVRRHRGKVTGWASYTVASASNIDNETGAEYAPAWDRRHHVDAAVVYQPSARVALSLRGVYSSGRPFWPPVGAVSGARFSPRDGNIQGDHDYVLYSDAQERMPDQFRLDGSVRFAFPLRGLTLEGYVGAMNLRVDPVVLYYQTRLLTDAATGAMKTVLEPASILPAFPSIGVEVRF